MLKNAFNPAIFYAEEETPAEMYTEEFQETLSSWFEKQGIVTDLRTYLRHHLINVLKDNSNNSPDVSPVPPFKTQAINLLIAEYLLKNKHYHAFSVLSMEVPLIGIISEFTKLPQSKLTQFNKNIKSKQFQLSDSKIWDVLTVFGFDPFSTQGQNIHESYLNCIAEPLITHIVNYLCDLNTNKLELDKDEITIENDDDLLKSFETILLRLQLPQSTSQHLISYLKMVLNQLITKIHADELFKFNALQTQIQHDIKQKEQTITSLIDEIEKNFLTEKQTLLETLKEKQDKCVFEINKNKTEYNNKLKALKQREHLLVKRENGLLSKLRELENKQIEFNQKQTSQDATMTEIEQLKLRIVQQGEQIHQLMFRNANLSNDLEQAKETVTILVKNQSEPCKYPEIIIDRDDSMDEILRETKQRLEKLKIETQTLDQSFRDYKLRQTQH